MTEEVITALEGAFRGRGWQGPTLSGALRGVGAKEAATAPANGRKTIWQHALHTAYWKHSVARILNATTLEHAGKPSAHRAEIDRLAIRLRPANWPLLPNFDELSWRSDRRILEDTHNLLIEVARAIPSKELSKRPAPKYKWTIAQYLVGVASHDMYHCGQIQLIKRLVRSGTHA